jgi:DNA-binding NarL/FixJ family response regulator
MPIRVLLVELPSLLRETVRSAFDPESNVVVVGEADGGDQAVEELGSSPPDIVFMDVRMPDMDGIEITEAIREASPSTKVILFMEASGARIPETIRAGVSGYLLEDASTQDLVDAVRLALRDKAVVDPTLVRPLLEAVQATGERDEGPHLSRRDRRSCRRSRPANPSKTSPINWSSHRARSDPTSSASSRPSPSADRPIHHSAWPDRVRAVVEPEVHRGATHPGAPIDCKSNLPRWVLRRTVARRRPSDVRQMPPVSVEGVPAGWSTSRCRAR